MTMGRWRIWRGVTYFWSENLGRVLNLRPEFRGVLHFQGVTKIRLRIKGL